MLVDAYPPSPLAERGHTDGLIPAEAAEEIPGGGFRLSAPAHGVETTERCEFWFAPREVWEVRGAGVK